MKKIYKDIAVFVGGTLFRFRRYQAAEQQGR